MVIRNPSFEEGIAGWDIESVAGFENQFDEPVEEVVEIDTSNSFDQEASLRLGVFSPKTSGREGARRPRQFVIPNNGNPVSSPSNHVTVWVGNRSFNQPKRYDFKNILFFSNGKLDPLNPDATTLLFRHNFRGPQVDIAEEERRGSDGNMWSRYTVEIPSGIDRENMSLAFVNYYDTWIVFDRFRQEGWGRVNIDSFQFTDSAGNPVEAPEPDISISELLVPEAVAVGDAVTVQVEVVNEGDAPGTTPVAVTAAGATAGSVQVTVDPGETRVVEIIWTPATEGQVEVCAELETDTICRAVTVAPPPCTVNNFLQDQGIDVEIPVVGEVPCTLALLGGMGLGATLLAVD